MLDTELAEKPTVSRRHFLRRGLWLGAGAMALGSYSTLYEPNDIQVRTIDVHLRRLPSAFDGFRIAQISDIHYGEFLGANHVVNVVGHANAAKPDLVVATGDFVTLHWDANNQSRKHDARVAEPCAVTLTGLKSAHGAVAVLGNHDYGTDPGFVADALSSHGIRVLRNQAYPLEIAGQRLWVAGIDDALGRAADISGTMAQVPPGEACVVLVHEPDLADSVARYPADLQLSGHSHGGQIRIPLLGAPVLPELGRKYSLGSYRVRDLQLYTNPGVGVINLPMRFDCPPEVTVFTLRAGSGPT
jgi:uncharacterized protein